jgi:hypothetical protein
MIKIFDRTEAFPEKVNFVDDHGTLVGYDMDGQCCEEFGWFIKDTDLNSDNDGGQFTLDNYYFDRKYYKKKFIGEDRTEIRFRLCEYKSEKYLFLCLYNSHNGYYSHGFNFETEDKSVIHKDCI